MSCDLEKLERPRLFTDFEADYQQAHQIRIIRDAFSKIITGISGR